LYLAESAIVADMPSHGRPLRPRSRDRL